MARTVAEQPGVIDVPDLFAVVIGPTSVIVNGDVSLAENLDLRAAEQVIAEATEALRQRWSLVEFVYLTPVPFARPRRNAKRRGVPPLGLPVARGDRGSRSQLPT
jgi:divalent metal cation (Fe/Co/Zn/Cd) transporter